MASTRAVQESLGPGPELSVSARRMLGILTSPENNKYVGYAVDDESILESLTSDGEDTSWFGVMAIAERLWAYYEQRPNRPDDGAGAFSFTLDRCFDGDVETYQVAMYLGDGSGTWLSIPDDVKGLIAEKYGPDGGSGLRKAIRIGEVIDDGFQQVRSQAERLGLISTASSTTSPVPETAANTAVPSRRSVLEAVTRMESLGTLSVAATVAEMTAAAYVLASTIRAQEPTASRLRFRLESSAQGDRLILLGWEDASGRVTSRVHLPGPAQQAAAHLYVPHIGSSYDIGAVPGLRATNRKRTRFVLDIDQVVSEYENGPPIVEAIVVRDPDGPTDLGEVAAAGVAVDARYAAMISVDAGSGWEWEDWAAHRDQCLSSASAALRPAVRGAFSCPPGGEHVQGRSDRDWLDGVVL